MSLLKFGKSSIFSDGSSGPNGPNEIQVKITKINAFWDLNFVPSVSSVIKLTSKCLGSSRFDLFWNIFKKR